MKRFKTISLACVAVLALTASVGAAAASARTVYQADGTTVAANGTTFTSSGPVKLSNSFITNNCTQSVNGSITNNGANNAAITSNLSSISYSSCNFPTTANTNNWTLTLPQSGNPGTVSGVDVTVNVFGTSCKFRTDATHTVNGSWTNGSPSSVSYSGSVVLYSGSAFVCGSSGTVTGSGNITSTSTPGNNLLILPAP